VVLPSHPRLPGRTSHARQGTQGTTGRGAEEAGRRLESLGAPAPGHHGYGGKLGLNVVTQRLGPCPCGCGVVGTKLKKRSCGEQGCVVGCRSLSCQGRRNRRAGPDAARNRHRRLGGEGATPHDEMGRVYSVEHVVQDKKGKQIPRNLVAFLRSEWARHAWAQAERVTPEGVAAFPTIYVELRQADGGGWYLITRGT
jgi:hypothetical protein